MDSWDDQLAHFKSIPWCANLVSDPDLMIRPPVSRFVNPSNRAFELWSTTLNSAATIPFCLGYMHPPSQSMVDAAAENSPSTPEETLDGAALEARYSTKVYFLLTLGHGLTSFREGLCHGGIVATIFDECNGAVGMANKMYGLMKPVMHVTQSLNLTCLRPVPTMTTVLVTARLVRMEARRFVVEGEMTDGEGAVLARAEAVYIVLDKKKMGVTRVGVKERL